MASGQTSHYGWEWNSGWRQYLMPIWRWLNTEFWLHNLKNNISTSVDVGIGHQINIDITSWSDIEFWSPDLATEI